MAHAPAPAFAGSQLEQPTSVRDIVAFFVLAYALAWSLWLPVLLVRSRISNSVATLLWTTGVFAPAVSAIILRFVRRGWPGVKQLLAPILQIHFPVRWWFFAAFFMLVVKLAAALLVRAFAGHWPPFGHDWFVVIVAATLFSTPFQAGEEIGWRGYALPALATRTGYAWASLCVGVFWALWHLPQFLFPPADTYRQSFVFFALEVIAISVAMAWAYTRSHGSLLLMMFMHSANNNTKDVVPSAAKITYGVLSLHASAVLYATVAVLWIAAAYFFVRMRREASSL